jgi:hypothetical protein
LFVSVVVSPSAATAAVGTANTAIKETATALMKLLVSIEMTPFVG